MLPVGNATFISAKELSRTSYFGTSPSSPSTFLKPAASSPTNSGAKYFLNVSTCLFLKASAIIFSKRTIAASLCTVFACLAGVGAAKQVETAVASAIPQVMTCRFTIDSRPLARRSSTFYSKVLQRSAQRGGRGGGSVGKSGEGADVPGAGSDGARNGRNSDGTKSAQTSYSGP